MEIELTKYRREVVDYLRTTRASLTDHIVEVHRGWPASTCHRCLSYQQSIQSNERVLQEIDAGTWDISVVKK